MAKVSIQILANSQHVRRTAQMSARGVRLVGAFMLACLLPCAVSAYTIIMRGGRHMTAPAAFVVTQTALTYTAAPGLSVTLPLTQIDIAATERANNEAPGSLLRRIGAQATQTAAPLAAASEQAHKPARTLTNHELEPLRRARLERERADEARRKSLGLPPLPVNEVRSAAEEAQVLRRIARQYEQATAQAENYWRGRAATLRIETAALDAELDFLRARLTVALRCFGSAFPTSPSVIIPFYAPRLPTQLVPAGNFSVAASDTRAQASGTIAIGGGAARSQILLNQQSASSTLQRRVIGPHGAFAAPVAVFAVPFNYAAVDDGALRARLIALEAARAGLDARWQQLEDEARRAGALPGWLRQ